MGVEEIVTNIKQCVALDQTKREFVDEEIWAIIEAITHCRFVSSGTRRVETVLLVSL